MKIKDIVIVVIICICMLGIYFLDLKPNTKDNVNNIYNVYLNGKIIGKINDKQALYTLIDEKQSLIKEKFNVKNVYPPKSLQIVENYSYDNQINSIDEVYNVIEKEQDFTIPGYEVTFSLDGKEKFKVNLLDKNILDDAIKAFIYAFIDEEDFNDYMAGTVEPLEDAKINYSNLDILENITIREKYISVNDKIYENSEELAQSLLFGFDYKESNYTVKEGDTIESISENTEPPLNVQEFLVANPKFTSKDSLLTVGDTVNITLINPQISLSYTINEMKEVEEQFDKKVVRDNTKPSDFYEITTLGVTGLSIQKSRYNVVNGEPNSQVDIYERTEIRKKVDQVTTRGAKSVSYGNLTFDGSGTGWSWPTGVPYMITSEFAPRWGKYHNGMDISGTGFGSNIYAAGDGVVVAVNTGCPDKGYYGNKCGNTWGNYAIINHGDNIYTLYAHMRQNIEVKVGQTVSKKQVIGHMGSSGSSTGTHLHFGLSIGMPLQGGTFKNPRELFK